MARLRLRPLSRTIHLWIGVALFVVLAPLGVTGSYLVYDDQIDALLHSQRHAASGPAVLQLSVYVQAAREAFGSHAQPGQLRLPQGPNGGPVTDSRARGTQIQNPAMWCRLLQAVGERRQTKPCSKTPLGHQRIRPVTQDMNMKRPNQPTTLRPGWAMNRLPCSWWMTPRSS